MPRSAFAWLVDVRYLGGNPWSAVNDPPAVRRMNGMKIDRALPVDLWRRLRDERDVRCDDSLAAQPREFGAIGQWRVVRAAILLMGDSGLRREEAASARRECLRPSAYGTIARPVWELTIVGKGQRERTVPVSAATFAALQAHWQDRGMMFDGTQTNGAPATIPYGPLLAPVVIPWTKASRRRHRHAGTGDPHPPTTKSSQADEAGYMADGLNRLIGRMMKCLVETMDTLSLDERV